MLSSSAHVNAGLCEKRRKARQTFILANQREGPIRRQRHIHEEWYTVTYLSLCLGELQRHRRAERHGADSNPESSDRLPHPEGTREELRISQSPKGGEDGRRGTSSSLLDTLGSTTYRAMKVIVCITIRRRGIAASSSCGIPVQRKLSWLLDHIAIISVKPSERTNRLRVVCHPSTLVATFSFCSQLAGKQTLVVLN